MQFRRDSIVYVQNDATINPQSTHVSKINDLMNPNIVKDTLLDLKIAWEQGVQVTMCCTV